MFVVASYHAKNVLMVGNWREARTAGQEENLFGTLKEKPKHLFYDGENV